MPDTAGPTVTPCRTELNPIVWSIPQIFLFLIQHFHHARAQQLAPLQMLALWEECQVWFPLSNLKHKYHLSSSSAEAGASEIKTEHQFRQRWVCSIPWQRNYCREDSKKNVLLEVMRSMEQQVLLRVEGNHKKNL